LFYRNEAYSSLEKDLVTDHGSEPSNHDEDSMYGMPPMDSFNSGGGMRGSDPVYIGISDAVWSTVVIKTPPNEKDVSGFLVDRVSSEYADVVEGPSTPPSQEPPPAYTGSVRSPRRSSYATRNNSSRIAGNDDAVLGEQADRLDGCRTKLCVHSGRYQVRQKTAALPDLHGSVRGCQDEERGEGDGDDGLGMPNQGSDEVKF
jgi:hypothetical protein